MPTARRYRRSCISEADAEFALNCANTRKGAIPMIARRPTPNPLFMQDADNKPLVPITQLR